MFSSFEITETSLKCLPHLWVFFVHVIFPRVSSLSLCLLEEKGKVPWKRVHETNYHGVPWEQGLLLLLNFYTMVATTPGVEAQFRSPTSRVPWSWEPQLLSNEMHPLYLSIIDKYGPSSEIHRSNEELCYCLESVFDGTHFPWRGAIFPPTWYK